MNTPAIWPYFLTIPAFLMGGLLGWYLSTLRRKTPSVPQLAASFADQLADQRRAANETEAELRQLETRLTTLNQLIARTREQIRERDDEYASLLLELETQRNLLDDTHHELETIEHDMGRGGRHPDSILADIDASLEEIELLSQVEQANRVKIRRLAQQVQWQDSELQMLRQAIKNKTTEIDETKALLERRDAELRRLIRQRQQREADIERARDLLSRLDEQLRRFVQRQYEATMADGRAPQPDTGQTLHVEPPAYPRLAPGASAPESDGRSSRPVDNREDDLTAIAGLADFYAEQLKRKGVRTYEQLARFQPQDLQKILEIPGHYSPDIEGWINAAREIVRRRTTEDKS
ncbi:MAG: hypothetical protein Kow00124_12630 [Anaerolineae bacterium]